MNICITWNCKSYPYKIENNRDVSYTKVSMFISYCILHLQEAFQDIDWKSSAIKQRMDLQMWNLGWSMHLPPSTNYPSSTWRQHWTLPRQQTPAHKHMRSCSAFLGQHPRPISSSPFLLGGHGTRPKPGMVCSHGILLPFTLNSPEVS